MAITHTAKVCIVIGTGKKGIDILADNVSNMLPISTSDIIYSGDAIFSLKIDPISVSVCFKRYDKRN
tara:strand:- start:172 stop:372 length:201 start_codon:yes stop_codon:yes gene_type:complete